jgi:arginine decarboxylase
VAVVRRLPLEVRPVVTEILRGLEELKGAAWGLLQAAALPPRQPDHAHPHHQERPERGGARLLRAGTRAGAGLQFLDVGGGLGVDYDGSQTNFESSMNYTLQEYANDVVYHIQTVCDEAASASDHRLGERPRRRGVPQRAVFNVLGTSGFGEEKVPETVREDFEQPLVDLLETLPRVNKRNASRATTTRSRRSTWR